MAFNFNWTPLAADTDFYKRAQDLLTGALNKSPKPPIIVDDIVVHEMNLGSVPPDLEILEIGDLAEDRFRGIFKMRYSGDAFLTLKTRVQANPLNTYLSTRPTFGSPEPLAAASGLTIPLTITLSNIKLSAFIILVFSKQKGITLVFRNDPLESLKVSSTFDSISFVRTYLQKEIENQLRTILMDQVPAIIHRLSLRLFVPEFREQEDSELAKASENAEKGEIIKDPLASPPQDPVDMNGNVLDSSQIASLTLDSATELHSLFSRKNLIRLATLSESNRTLSLFSPSMKDVVYRALAGQMERSDSPGIQSPVGASLSRKHSQIATSNVNTYTFSTTASESGSHYSHMTRPSLISQGSSFTASNFGQHSKAKRKRKHRTINLRKPKLQAEEGENISEGGSVSGTLSSTTSESGRLVATLDRDELITPPSSPSRSFVRPHPLPGIHELDRSPPKHPETTPRPTPLEKQKDPMTSPPPARPLFEPGPSEQVAQMEQSYIGSQLSDSMATIRPKPTRYFGSWQPPSETSDQGSSRHHSRANTTSQRLAAPFPYTESSPGGILEQAWMMKMAGEIARRVSEQKATDSRHWDNTRLSTPPPAYAS